MALSIKRSGFLSRASWITCPPPCEGKCCQGANESSEAARVGDLPPKPFQGLDPWPPRALGQMFGERKKFKLPEVEDDHLLMQFKFLLVAMMHICHRCSLISWPASGRTVFLKAITSVFSASTKHCSKEYRTESYCHGTARPHRTHMRSTRKGRSLWQQWRMRVPGQSEATRADGWLLGQKGVSWDPKASQEGAGPTVGTTRLGGPAPGSLPSWGPPFWLQTRPNRKVNDKEQINLERIKEKKGGGRRKTRWYKR